MISADTPAGVLTGFPRAVVVYCPTCGGVSSATHDPMEAERLAVRHEATRSNIKPHRPIVIPATATPVGAYPFGRPPKNRRQVAPVGARP